jgi:hypothetical protein
MLITAWDVGVEDSMGSSRVTSSRCAQPSPRVFPARTLIGSEKKLNLPGSAHVAMAGAHQQQQLRRTPLLFAGQIPTKRIVSEGVALRIFPKAFEKAGVSGQ